MPSINTIPSKAAEHVSLSSHLHPRIIFFYSSGHYDSTKYYIIASVIASMMITSLGIYIGFKARLNGGLPLRPYEKYLFKSAIEKHERKREAALAALAAQEEARQSTHAAAPVNDAAAFPSYPHHMDGNHADGGAKSVSPQEPAERDGDEALPAYEPPAGPSPSAVMR
ncbi:hypothetical protein TgHK011_008497 [Trichoderma gracile]|nr:hypothetical protein TgHK011_008497 [Trichoderma gracile]